jgi:hypothetical protein
MNDPVAEQLKKIDDRLGRIERHIRWEFIMSTARLIIILIPIALALIYIPPFIKRYVPLAEQLSVQAQSAVHYLQKMQTGGR